MVVIFVPFALTVNTSLPKLVVATQSPSAGGPETSSGFAEEEESPFDPPQPIKSDPVRLKTSRH
jgi:hypothetical protein